MPHLSPFNWLIMTPIFWITLLLLTTAMWWQQTPKFPLQMNPYKMNQTPWNWR